MYAMVYILTFWMIEASHFHFYNLELSLEAVFHAVQRTAAGRRQGNGYLKMTWFLWCVIAFMNLHHHAFILIMLCYSKDSVVYAYSMKEAIGNLTYSVTMVHKI